MPCGDKYPNFYCRYLKKVKGRLENISIKMCLPLKEELSIRFLKNVENIACSR